MNKIEIKAMIPEVEYKRARIKADIMDALFIAMGIAGLLVALVLIKDNEKLLQQSDYWCGQYNTVNSQLDQLNQKYEELEIQYNELLNEARLQDKLEVFSEVE